MTRCPSTFFGAQCDGTTGHRGHHWSDTPVDVNSYSVVWTDKSADDSPGHDFEPGFHDDECTYSSDGTWNTYCGKPKWMHNSLK